MVKIDPNFAKNMSKYGSPNVSICFNCGTCTAICPLSSETEGFPRKVIRYAQLGLKEKVLQSASPWLCYYCGECSDTCPREAEPGELMMALRRYAISSNAWGISRRIYTSRLFTTIFIGLTSLLALLLIAFFHGPLDWTSVRLLDFLPTLSIEVVGSALGAFVLISALFNIISMGRNIYRGIPKSPISTNPNVIIKTILVLWRWLKELVITIVLEVIAQIRYFKCKESEGRLRHIGIHVAPHLAMVWGFLGLLLTTTLRFMIIPTHGEIIPFTEPTRILGIICGILLIYGSVMTISNRILKVDKSNEYSTYTDWIFLILLLLSGVTGFFVTISHYAYSPIWAYFTLVVHIIIVFQLFLLAPFTKFAHSIYRPMAIWICRVYRSI